jgi:hypothetical protein
MTQKKKFLLLTKTGWKVEKIGVADIVLVNFPKYVPPGRQQAGERPAVVLGFMNFRFSRIILLPLSSLYDEESGRKRTLNDDFPHIYPVLRCGGIGNLDRDSIVLTDSRSVLEGHYILGKIGELDSKQYELVTDAYIKAIELSEMLK